MKDHTPDDPGYHDILENSGKVEFTIGQIYEDTPAAALRCKICKSENFIVGTGSYFTALKCSKCEWEYCIHTG